MNNTNTSVSTSNYKTYTFEADLEATAKNYRCKVELSTVVSTNRPTAKNLRSIMKNI